MELKGIKLVSGGQTGADRAALDFAIEHGIPHGGWWPKGRLEQAKNRLEEAFKLGDAKKMKLASLDDPE